MPSIAVTGSIGSGKSLITTLLSKHLSSVTYSADQDNAKLLESDPDVKKEIVNLFGAEAYGSDGRPDRNLLRTAIHASPSLKNRLEAILHPRLRSRWEPLAKEYRAITDRFLIAEMPLLFENRLQDRFDVTVTVACSPEVAARRLKEGRDMSSEEIDSWRSGQLAQEEKISRANHVLWNDGSRKAADAQSAFLASLLAP
jgi:dephospho-CoA kinase